MAWWRENISDFASEDICGMNWVSNFNKRNLDIPEWIRFHISQINSESSKSQWALKDEIINNFIRSSISVSSWNIKLDNYIYLEIFTLLQDGLIESRGTLKDIDFSDYVLRDILTNALVLFSTDYSTQYKQYYDSGLHIITFGDIYIDISWLLDHTVKKEDILQAQHRPEHLINSVFQDIEWENWFQKEKNWGVTLSDAYGEYWFPEDLKKWIEIFFKEKYWEDFVLKTSWEQQIKKLIRFVLEVESHGWYNIVLDDRVRTSWYYQFQVNDWKIWKEIYDFRSKTFREIDWGWKKNDKEVKIVTWENKQWIRKVHKKSSYELWLSSLPESILERFWWLREQTQYIGEHQVQQPETLSSTEQTILFLSNIYTKGNDISKELFSKILDWDDIAIIEIYREIHHWDTSNRKTLHVVQRVAESVLWISYNW